MTTKQWQPIETFVLPKEPRWIAFCYKSKGGVVTSIKQFYNPSASKPSLFEKQPTGDYYVALDSEHETLPPYPKGVVEVYRFKKEGSIKEYLNNGSNSPEAKELVAMQEVPTNDVLLTAKSLKEGNRADQYGTASIMFKRIADFWNTYLGVDLIKAHDVGHMMALMKIARSVKDPKHFDSAVDAAAYIALAHEVATESE